MKCERYSVEFCVLEDKGTEEGVDYEERTERGSEGDVEWDYTVLDGRFGWGLGLGKG